MNVPSLDPTHAPSVAHRDARDFFDGSGHLRVLRHLEQAIAQDDRLMVLTGDEGVGKTTVVQLLLHGLDHRNTVWCVLLSATHLDTGELPGSLARAFGAPGVAPSPAELRATLRQHLLRLGKGRTVLAVVDDAHALPPEAIVELGETIREGPLRVLLVGRPALRMLLQRQLPLHPASLECHLEPLQDSETAAYLAFRLQRVAGNGAPAFSDEAKALIHRFSRGVPMRIDRLCDRLLRAARQRGLGTVGAGEVQRIARPRLDYASIPMLTNEVDDPPSSGWAIATAPESMLPPKDEPPEWAVAPAALPKRAGTRTRRQRAGLALSVVVVASVLGLVAWRYFEPLRVNPMLTASPPPLTPSPSPPLTPSPSPPLTPSPSPPLTPSPSPPLTPSPSPSPSPTPTAVLAEPAPAAAPTKPAPTAARTTPAPAPARATTSTPIAPPAAVPGPCTAAVVALGLCTQSENGP
jgi:type II secretory pathway predicted ATPase ExeA